MRAGIFLLLIGIGCGGSAAPRASAPPAPAPAFAVREIEVRIPARGLDLEGTLALPRAPSPRPGVILVQGSGPLGRDELLPGQLGMMFGFEVAVFRELARELARAGFVVIRFDKRTCTRAHGCANHYPDADVGFDDVLEDAQAVVDWLRARPEVDRHALFVVGHSLGGAFVPELMTDNPDLRAGVAIAAPFRPIDLTSIYQHEYAERLLLSQNKHPMVIGVRVRELKEVADGVRRLRAGTLKQAHIAGTAVEFWQAWMDLGDALPAVLARLDRPLLALSGTADANVPTSETTLWRRALRSTRPDPGHEIAVLPCVTHALNCLRVDARGRPVSVTRHLDPRVAARVITFLRRHLPH
jgi:dienelactone hydrolase